MTRKDLFTAALVVALTLAAVGSVGLGLAQEPPKPQNEQALPVVGPEALLGTSIPVQGRLTDASGTPLNGTASVTFKLYTAASGGTALCTDGPRNITVTNGLFADYVTGCNYSVFNGQQLYLGVKVGSDAEMAPRLPVYAVPYAMSVRPGAIVEGSQSGWNAIYAENTASSGSSYGIRALSHSPNGRGVSGEGYGGAVGVYAYSTGSGRYQAALRAGNTNPTNGMAGYFTNSSGFATAHFANAGSGEVLYLQSNGGPYIRAVDNAESVELFKVSGAGSVSQAPTANGLLKAAAVAVCTGASSSVVRSFNSNGGSITVSDDGFGGCILDFHFSVTDRFYTAMATGVLGDRAANCISMDGDPTKLHCARWMSSTGTWNGGEIIVLVY